MTCYKKGDIIYVQMTVGIDGVFASDGLHVWAAYNPSKPSNCHNVPVTAILKHVPRELQVGDYIKSKISIQSCKYKILALHKNTAWVIGDKEEEAHTVYISNFERV